MLLIVEQVWFVWGLSVRYSCIYGADSGRHFPRRDTIMRLSMLVLIVVCIVKADSFHYAVEIFPVQRMIYHPCFTFEVSASTFIIPL